LEDLRHRWEDGIKMYVGEIRCEDMDWTRGTEDGFECYLFLTHGSELYGYIKARNFMTSR
jgi:hypothetical protein